MFTVIRSIFFILLAILSPSVFADFNVYVPGMGSATEQILIGMNGMMKTDDYKTLIIAAVLFATIGLIFMFAVYMKGDRLVLPLITLTFLLVLFPLKTDVMIHDDVRGHYPVVEAPTVPVVLMSLLTTVSKGMSDLVRSWFSPVNGQNNSYLVNLHTKLAKDLNQINIKDERFDRTSNELMTECILKGWVANRGPSLDKLLGTDGWVYIQAEATTGYARNKLIKNYMTNTIGTCSEVYSAIAQRMGEYGIAVPGATANPSSPTGVVDSAWMAIERFARENATFTYNAYLQPTAIGGLVQHYTNWSAMMGLANFDGDKILSSVIANQIIDGGLDLLGMQNGIDIKSKINQKIAIETQKKSWFYAFASFQEFAPYLVNVLMLVYMAFFPMIVLIALIFPSRAGRVIDNWIGMCIWVLTVPIAIEIANGVINSFLIQEVQDLLRFGYMNYASVPFITEAGERYSAVSGMVIAGIMVTWSGILKANQMATDSAVQKVTTPSAGVERTASADAQGNVDLNNSRMNTLSGNQFDVAQKTTTGLKGYEDHSHSGGETKEGLGNLYRGQVGEQTIDNLRSKAITNSRSNSETADKLYQETVSKIEGLTESGAYTMSYQASKDGSQGYVVASMKSKQQAYDRLVGLGYSEDDASASVYALSKSDKDLDANTTTLGVGGKFFGLFSAKNEEQRRKALETSMDSSDDFKEAFTEYKKAGDTKKESITSNMNVSHDHSSSERYGHSQNDSFAQKIEEAQTLSNIAGSAYSERQIADKTRSIAQKVDVALPNTGQQTAQLWNQSIDQQKRVKQLNQEADEAFGKIDTSPKDNTTQEKTALENQSVDFINKDGKAVTGKDVTQRGQHVKDTAVKNLNQEKTYTQGEYQQSKNNISQAEENFNQSEDIQQQRGLVNSNQLEVDRTRLENLEVSFGDAGSEHLKSTLEVVGNLSQSERDAKEKASTIALQNLDGQETVMDKPIQREEKYQGYRPGYGEYNDTMIATYTPIGISTDEGNPLVYSKTENGMPLREEDGSLSVFTLDSGTQEKESEAKKVNGNEISFYQTQTQDVPGYFSFSETSEALKKLENGTTDKKNGNNDNSDSIEDTGY